MSFENDRITAEQDLEDFLEENRKFDARQNTTKKSGGMKMTKKVNGNVAVKLAEWLKNKLGTTAEYWDTHLTKSGKVKLAKWIRLKREVKEYEDMIKTDYKDLLTTESVVTTKVVTEQQKLEMIQYAIENDMLKSIDIKVKDFEKLGFLKDCEVKTKVQTKMVATNIIEKYLEKCKEDEVKSELTA